ncbi:MAG: GAF domain-containing protein [Cyanobacteria bacterium P01_A01_bin.84]
MTEVRQESQENNFKINEANETNDINQEENIEIQSESIDFFSGTSVLKSDINEDKIKFLRDYLFSFNKQINQISELDQLLEFVTKIIRRKFEIDKERILIYQFDSDDSGIVLAESIAAGWTPTLGERLLATIFGLDSAKEYSESIFFEDIKAIEPTPYQSQLLEKFQVKASLVIPILVTSKTWGLLAIHSCEKVYQWQEFEIIFLESLVSSLSKKLQELEFTAHIERQSKKQKSLTKVIDQIQKASNIEEIFQTTTKEVRKLLQCDRVGVYRFNPDWSGEFVAESLINDWTPLVNTKSAASDCGIQKLNNKKVEDTYLQENQGGRYKNNDGYVVNDIYKAGFSSCYIEVLEDFEAKAYMTVPIFRGDKLWGLLAAYQNSQPRQWKNSEFKFIKQVAAQFGIAIAQADYIQKIQEQSREVSNTAETQQKIINLTATIGKILTEKTIDDSQFNSILVTTVAEIRSFLKTDRTAIYRFNTDWSGQYIAESMGQGLTPFRETNIDPELLKENGHCNSIRGLEKPSPDKVDPYFKQMEGGRYKQKTAFVVNNVSEQGFPRCYLDLLEQLGVQAYLTVPIFRQNKLWGLLANYQHSETRQWEESDVKAIEQVGLQLGVVMQQAEIYDQLQQQSEKITEVAELDRSVNKIIDRIRKAQKIDDIFNIATQELRTLITADRIGLYQFNQDWSGQFVAESVASGWLPLVGPDIVTRIEDTYLQETKGGRYRFRESYAVNDIYNADHNSCHIEILESLQAKAYIIVPVLCGQKLWGLLAAYQNSETREWQDAEIQSLARIGDQLGVAVQQVEYLQETQEKSEQIEKAADRQRAVTKVIEKIRQSLDIQTIFATTTKEVRSLLNNDRVAVYKLNPDYSGVFVSESVSPGWDKLINKQYEIPQLQESINGCPTMRTLFREGNLLEGEENNVDPYLQTTQGKNLQSREAYIVNDIYAKDFNECYIEVLEQYQAKAYAIVPIFQGETLWGMLAAYQNDAPREWEEIEIDLLSQISKQLSVALTQVEIVRKLKEQSEKFNQAAERDRALNKVINKIRQSLDINTIFATATKEMRSLLQTDRVAVYQLNPDYTGVFVAESVNSGWYTLVDRQYEIFNIQESVNLCPRMRSLFRENKLVEEEEDIQLNADPYLQLTQAAELKEGMSYIANDIYAKGFNECYVEVLEQYQAKAYAIVPIFQGQKLWGMFAAYQNDGPREWEEIEVNLLSQVADQLGVALQQVEYLEKLQTQSKQVKEAAEREKEAREYLQKGAIGLLSAVRPALNGDLTVRAPITEDELGTIADAYNNTLQALRQIVIQVQAAAQQVAETSQNSTEALVGLTGSAQQQSREINEALEEIQQTVDSTEAVVTNAESVQEAVQKANETVNLGDVAMNRTVETIEGIRETVSQTGKKIKRLSESSQKISKVVSLISSFATQTNVLALNAAIEATRAGEYGKGFAVVADEVRSLSRQSAAATIEIEKLVQEIQEETGEVAVAMETGIKQVVEGTTQVNETRQSLNAIVTATGEISNLLQLITDATQTQMLQSVSATTSMKDVAAIAQETSTQANNISVVFQQLSETAQELISSVSRFKVD